MSVELAIKIGNRFAPGTPLFQMFSNILKAQLGVDSQIANAIEKYGECRSDENLDFIAMCVEDDAEIECQYHCAGSIESLGEDGGDWIYVSVVERNPRSFALMIIVATCFAVLNGSNIIDESGIIGDKREVFTCDIFNFLTAVKEKTFLE